MNRDVERRANRSKFPTVINIYCFVKIVKKQLLRQSQELLENSTLAPDVEQPAGKIENGAQTDEQSGRDFVEESPSVVRVWQDVVRVEDRPGPAACFGRFPGSYPLPDSGLPLPVPDPRRSEKARSRCVQRVPFDPSFEEHRGRESDLSLVGHVGQGASQLRPPRGGR